MMTLYNCSRAGLFFQKKGRPIKDRTGPWLLLLMIVYQTVAKANLTECPNVYLEGQRMLYSFEVMNVLDLSDNNLQFKDEHLHKYEVHNKILEIISREVKTRRLHFPNFY
jgi:hypothetical protein